MGEILCMLSEFYMCIPVCSHPHVRKRHWSNTKIAQRSLGVQGLGFVYIYIRASCIDTQCAIYMWGGRVSEHVFLPFAIFDFPRNVLCEHPMYRYLSIHLSIYLPIYLFIYRSVYLSTYLFIYLSIDRSIYLSIDEVVLLNILSLVSAYRPDAK